VKSAKVVDNAFNKIGQFEEGLLVASAISVFQHDGYYIHSHYNGNEKMFYLYRFDR